MNLVHVIQTNMILVNDVSNVFMLICILRNCHCKSSIFCIPAMSGIQPVDPDLIPLGIGSGVQRRANEPMRI